MVDNGSNKSSSGGRDIYLEGHDVLRNLDSRALREKSRMQNIIITSRYTLLTFFPKSVFEQFRRLANVYFLVLGIIALIGQETKAYSAAVLPEGILAPMSVVILISMAKEAIEDYKRHKTDRMINAKPAKVIVPAISSSEDSVETIRDIQWKDIKAGDAILLQRDDEVPADIIILACGGVQGNMAYVETAAIGKSMINEFLVI
jgi:magnesium-transporting ATPase (P-type)